MTYRSLGRSGIKVSPIAGAIFSGDAKADYDKFVRNYP